MSLRLVVSASFWNTKYRSLKFSKFIFAKPYPNQGARCKDEGLTFRLGVTPVVCRCGAEVLKHVLGTCAGACWLRYSSCT